MYIPDPIERMEANIDDLIFEQLSGVPDGMIRCFDCKALVPLDSVESADAGPDAPAVCSACMDKRYFEAGGGGWQ